jgi:hypothetical protein
VRRATLAVAALPLLAAMLRAQVPPVFLAGNATHSGATHNVVLAPCTVPVPLCTPQIDAALGALGGAAYDAVNHVMWHSNGSRLQSSLAALGFECDLPCDAPSPIPSVTGLAFDARTSSLWLLGAAPEIARAAVPPGGVCPEVGARCSLAGLLPRGTVAAGLAFSEKRGLLFYAASAPGPNPVNVIVVAAAAEPCRAVCTIDLGAAFGAPQADPITGLGYDDCDDELFAVAGNAGIVRARLGFPGCTLLTRSLCVPPGDYRFNGLCLQAPLPRVVGRTCLGAGCPTCSTRLRANGATLGNHQFGFAVFSAPASGFAVPVFGRGACGAGLPFACGSFFPQLAPPPIVLPPLPLPGLSTCTGAGEVTLPIAADGALCGIVLCLQAAVLCPAGGLGLTNALEIRVHGA